MTLQFKLPKLGRPKAPHLWNNKAGNIAIITALVMIPLTFALGMAYDYTMAEARQDQIDGMADVATLAGVTPNQMANNWSTAQAFSQNLFASQIATVNGVVNSSPVWTGSDAASGVSVSRTMTVNYTAASQNVFASLLGMSTFPLKGSSTATSSTAPNIDFYLFDGHLAVDGDRGDDHRHGDDDGEHPARVGQHDALKPQDRLVDGEELAGGERDAAGPGRHAWRERLHVWLPPERSIRPDDRKLLCSVRLAHRPGDSDRAGGDDMSVPDQHLPADQVHLERSLCGRHDVQCRQHLPGNGSRQL